MTSGSSGVSPGQAVVARPAQIVSQDVHSGHHARRSLGGTVTSPSWLHFAIVAARNFVCRLYWLGQTLRPTKLADNPEKLPCQSSDQAIPAAVVASLTVLMIAAATL